MKHYLGIDIGGTAVKLGIVDEAGAVLAKAEESVSFDGYRTPILTTVLKAAQAFLAAQSVPAESLAGIGVSATGQIDSRKGIVAGTCGNLPNYIGAPIKAELEKTSGLMAATVDYAKTRPVFDGYKAARYSKKYLSEHEAELAAYRAARVTMNELLDGAKLPKMADMKKARQELAGKKKALYAEYRKAQADMRQAVAVKANIDHLLGVTAGQHKKEQER